MGQGAESAGGYEVAHNPYEDGLEKGVWTEKSGRSIKIKDMTSSHIKAVIRVCERASKMASFSFDSEMWDGWVDALNHELFSRPEKPKASPSITKVKNKVRGKMVDMKCHCGVEYQARRADLNRGWGKSCGKRCASIKREYGRPNAKELNHEG